MNDDDDDDDRVFWAFVVIACFCGAFAVWMVATAVRAMA